MAGFGITADEIARAIIDERTGRTISERTLQRYFAQELHDGPTVIKGRVLGFMARLGSGTLGASPQAATMAIYLTKARWGWRDRDFGDKPNGGKGPGDQAAADDIEIKGGLPERPTE